MNIHTKSKTGLRQIMLLLLIQSLFVVYGHAETDAVTSYWDNHNSSSHTRIDHSQWQTFLDIYLHQTEDGRSLVDYKNVTGSSYAGLKKYINTMARQDPRNLNRSEQMAYWINLYNALTVKVVVDNPDKTSITKMGLGLFSFGPWDENLLTITSQPLSLNDIEHRILRPIWKDDRVHFALNCASLGCPNLASAVYQSHTLEQSLTEARSQYLGHPRAVHFDARGHLHISSLFQWYLGDFATDETALMNYLAIHRPELRKQLLAYGGIIRYDYDWDLNTLTENTIDNVTQ